MEPKKNPKYDVHRKRGVLLNVGFVVSLLLVITAFKWTVPLRHPPWPPSSQDPIEGLTIDYPRPTNFKDQEAPKPKRMQSRIPYPVNIVVANDKIEDPNPSVGIDLGKDPDIDLSSGSIDLPIENPAPDTFRVVERMPEPVGGWQTFYKTLQKHIKYPKPAQRVGANGKVFVEFTVNEKGELSHFKIIKGIGYGCDEEATRVIALTKWTAGKQRGKPVNVKMVQPISFSLNN